MAFQINLRRTGFWNGDEPEKEVEEKSDVKTENVAATKLSEKKQSFSPEQSKGVSGASKADVASRMQTFENKAKCGSSKWKDSNGKFNVPLSKPLPSDVKKVQSGSSSDTSSVNLELKDCGDFEKDSAKNETSSSASGSLNISARAAMFSQGNLIKPKPIEKISKVEHVSHVNKIGHLDSKPTTNNNFASNSNSSSGQKFTAFSYTASQSCRTYESDQSFIPGKISF